MNNLAIYRQKSLPGQVSDFKVNSKPVHTKCLSGRREVGNRVLITIIIKHNFPLINHDYDLMLFPSVRQLLSPPG